MCGIVGYVGQQAALPVLLKGLKRLEYRGYDSAGVAYFEEQGVSIVKSEGKLDNIQRKIESLKGTVAHCGIGHTRWATHGKPTTQNAHPHRTGHVVLVHNGIIENYQEIKESLLERGHRPQSETDSELFGFLVLEAMDAGATLVDAVRTSFRKLHGACSVVVMSEREPGLIVGVRNGSPLVAAQDPKGGTFIASDAQPLVEYTREVTFLENGDVVIAQGNEFRIIDLMSGRPVKRAPMIVDWSAESMDKQGFPHYMLKEIHEQPTVLIDTLNGLLDRSSGKPFALAPQPGVELLRQAKNLVFIACGTSWHAALLAKYWIERFARIPVQVDLASEFRYRDPVLSPGTLVVAISQSGETADTLAVVRDLKRRGTPTLGLTNVRGSTLTREADATFFTTAGPEIGVAATKTFLSQMMTLFLWSNSLAPQPDIQSLTERFEQTLKLPHALQQLLDPNGDTHSAIERVAREFVEMNGFFFIGRGTSFPIALEGALKLKEIAYLHSEGYAAGELKHGPIAMIDERMAVVVLAPSDQWRDKTLSSLEEVKARGARILSIGHPHDAALRKISHAWIPLPAFDCDESLHPFFLAPILQLLSYRIAVLKGTDVDQPRNLAKSVTVE